MLCGLVEAYVHFTEMCCQYQQHTLRHHVHLKFCKLPPHYIIEHPRRQQSLQSLLSEPQKWPFFEQFLQMYLRVNEQLN